MGALLGLNEEPAEDVRDGGGPVVAACEEAPEPLAPAVGFPGFATAHFNCNSGVTSGAAGLVESIAASAGEAFAPQRRSRLAVEPHPAMRMSVKAVETPAT
jgi:hypothetical protein